MTFSIAPSFPLLETGTFGIALIKRQVVIVQIIRGYHNWTYAEVMIFKHFGDRCFYVDTFSSSHTARIPTSDFLALFPSHQRVGTHDPTSGMLELPQAAYADFTHFLSWNQRKMESIWERLPEKSRLLR